MRRLFWKIFLSFWVALILFAGTTMLSASLFLERTRTQDDASPRARLIHYIDEARLIAENNGLEGLKAWLKKLDRREAIPFLLIDAEGKDLLERPVSSRLSKRLNRPFRSPRRLSNLRFPGHRPLIQLADGSEYRLVPDFKGVTLGRVLRRPRVIATPIIVAALVSGLVCWLLARYLTTPLRQLSRATRQFATGDFSQRVSPGLGRRRDEIADLAQDFDRMAEHLQRLIGSHKQLLSDVSHELRSPLARLQVALGLARQRGQRRRPDAELDRIELEAERLNELIGQLLSLSRLEAGAGPYPKELVALERLLAAVALDADFEARVRNRQVRLVNSVLANINANEALLRSALENVVRNAARYTAEDTAVELSLQPEPERPGWLLIRVRDYGPGVREDVLPKLFEPFVRVGEARDRDSGGYGLGLAIAERAVRLHGGEISADNEPDGGLSVWIRLPGDQMTLRILESPR